MNDTIILTNSDCSVFPNRTDRCNLLIILKNVSSSLSIIGCIICLLVIFLFRRYRKFTQRLILYMMFSCLIHSITYLIGDPAQESFFCSLKGLFMTYTDWSLILWVSCLIHANYMNVIKFPNKFRYEWQYLVIGFGLPIVIACLPLFIKLEKYGPAGAWCWVTETSWQAGLWYIPVVILIAAMYAVYMYEIYYDLRKATNWKLGDPRAQKFYAEYVKPLRYYPLIYLLLNVNGLSFLPRFDVVVADVTFKLFLFAFLAFTIPLTGFPFTIAFLTDNETKKNMKLTELQPWLQSWFRSRPKENVSLSSSMRVQSK